MEKNKKIEKLEKQLEIIQSIQYNQLQQVIESCSSKNTFSFSIKNSFKTNQYLSLIVDKLKNFTNLQNLSFTLDQSIYQIHEGLEKFILGLQSHSSLNCFSMKLKSGLFSNFRIGQILNDGLKKFKNLIELNLEFNFDRYTSQSKYQTFDFSDIFFEIENLKSLQMYIKKAKSELMPFLFEGFSNLKVLKTLTILFEECNLTGEYGFKFLIKQLKNLMNLEELHLIFKDHNKIQEHEFIGLNDCFKTLKLKELEFELNYCNNSFQDGIGIQEGIKDLNYLKILNFKIKTYFTFKNSLEILRQVAKLQNLECLKIQLDISYETDEFDNQIIELKNQIQNLKNLKELKLNFYLENEFSLKQILDIIYSLKNQSQLELLMLDINKFNPNLDEFDIQIYEECISLLKNLKRFDLLLNESQANKNHKTLEFINKITKLCSQLQEIYINLEILNDFEEDENITETNQDEQIAKSQNPINELYQSILSMNQLTSIKIILENFEITQNEFANFFIYHPNLNNINVSLKTIKQNTDSQLDFNPLKFPNLSEFVIQLSGLQNYEDLKQIFNIIQQFQNLIILHFQFCIENQIQSTLFDQLEIILSQNQQLKSLIIHLNGQINFDYMRNLFKGLQQATLLNELDIQFSDAQITQEDIQFVQNCLKNSQKLKLFSFQNESFMPLYLVNLDLPLIGDLLFLDNSFYNVQKIQTFKLLPFHFDKQLNNNLAINIENNDFYENEKQQQKDDVLLKIEFKDQKQYENFEELNWVLSQTKQISKLQIEIQQKKKISKMYRILLKFKSLELCQNLKDLSLSIQKRNELDTESVLFLGSQINQLSNLENIKLQLDTDDDFIDWVEARRFFAQFSTLTNLKSLQFELKLKNEFGQEVIQSFFKSISSLKQLNILTIKVDTSIDLEILNISLNNCFQNLIHLKELNIGFSEFINQTQSNQKNFAKNLKSLQHVQSLTLIKAAQQMNITQQLNKMKRLVIVQQFHKDSSFLKFY